MKKKLLTAALVLFAAAQSFAQSKTDEITSKNSWLKAGLEASVPVGKTSDYSSFAAGLVLSGQKLVTNNFGIGLTTGYTNFFGKDNAEDQGLIPAGLMLRYYPQSQGFFIGTDVGYGFLTKGDVSGGAYVKPQLGYHNYSWNFYGFYNQVFINKGASIDLQNAGIAATYNIHFKRK